MIKIILPVQKVDDHQDFRFFFHIFLTPVVLFSLFSNFKNLVALADSKKLFCKK